MKRHEVPPMGELLPGEKVDFTDLPRGYYCGAKSAGGQVPLGQLPPLYGGEGETHQMAEEKPKPKPKRVMSEEQKAKIRATMLARYGKNRKKKNKGQPSGKARAKKAPKAAAAAPVSGVVAATGELIAQYGVLSVRVALDVLESRLKGAING